MAPLLPESPVARIMVFFLATQLLALWAGISLIEASSQIPEIKELSVAPTKNPDEPLNAVYFLAVVFAGAIFILLAIRLYKGPWIFRILEFVTVAGATSVLAFGILLSFPQIDPNIAVLAGGAAGFAFAVAKFLAPRLKNAAAIFSSAGVGAIFGFSAGIIPSLVFIIGISIYDYIAVFKTRHMLAMSRALGTSDLSFTVSATAPIPKTDVVKAKSSSAMPASKSQNASHEAMPSAITKMPSHSASASMPRHAYPSRLDLGTGDLAVPAMLAVSAYPFAGFAGSAAVVAGSAISLYFLLGFVVKKGVALPAMPPISLGALVALLLVVLAGL